jgi:hypothetical protein
VGSADLPRAGRVGEAVSAGRISREAIYQALFNLVTADPGIVANFRTVGRLLPQISQVSDEMCPALYTFQLPEKRAYEGQGVSAKRTLYVAFVCYFASTDPQATLPATLVNMAADAIDNAISYPGNPQNLQQLGGLVHHCRIEPDIRPYEGLLQEKSVLVAVVAILVP